MFHVGLSLTIQVPALKNPAKTRVIGWEKDLYIIVRLPFIDEKPLNVKSGNKCIVRFIKEGSAYGFETEVLTIQFYPGNLIFLKYPLHIESIPFRKFRRYKTNIPAKILGADKIDKIEALIFNISNSGCLLKAFVKTGSAFEIGAPYYITFGLMDKSIEADCIVRNSNIAKEGIQLLGVEFNNLAPHDEKLIQSFIEMLQDIAG